MIAERRSKGTILVRIKVQLIGLLYRRTADSYDRILDLVLPMIWISIDYLYLRILRLGYVSSG